MQTYKRKVFYLSGFDPRGARYYYHVYKDQAKKYAQLADTSITVSARSNPSATEAQWVITNDSEQVVTHYSFLRWDTLISRAWIRNPWALTRRSIKAYLGYFRHFNWRQLVSLPRAPLITFFYPPVTFVLIPALVLLLVHALLPGHLGGLTNWAISTVLAVIISTPLLRRLKSPWLLRFFVFNHEVCNHGSPELDAQLERFADCIVQGMNEPYDEILLVSHSNGSILTVPLMNKIFARLGATLPPNMHVVTLGHCIPLVGCVRNADYFHRELAQLSQHNFRWLDIGFPPDGACYAFTNPFLPHHPNHLPQLSMVSPRFFRYYKPENYRRLRRNKYQLHFQYLFCGDTLSPWNYFALTTSATTLKERIAQEAA